MEKKLNKHQSQEDTGNGVIEDLTSDLVTMPQTIRAKYFKMTGKIESLG